MDRPSGVSSARLASCAASARSSILHARQREELGRHAVAERDGAGLVEEQRVHVARRLHRAAAHGEHVLAQEPVHAGDADGGEQAADGGGDEAHQERHDRGGGERHARVERQRHQRHAGEEEDQRQADEQDVQRDLVGRLLPRRALDEARSCGRGRTRPGSAVMRDHDAVGEHLGAAGDRGAVAAGSRG